MTYQRHTYETYSKEPAERYEFDIHTHTIASGHGSNATITDMAKAAKAHNLKMLGISDHGPATLGGGRTSYFRNLRYAQKERLGIRMLYGAEANIINRKGDLDLGDDILKGLDYTIVSMHHPIIRTGTVEENTETYINAIKNPYVTVVGHCDDTNFPIDPFRLFAAAMKYHVLLEINNSSLSPEGYRGGYKIYGSHNPEPIRAFQLSGPVFQRQPRKRTCRGFYICAGSGKAFRSSRSFDP